MVAVTSWEVQTMLICSPAVILMLHILAKFISFRVIIEGKVAFDGRKSNCKAPVWEYQVDRDWDDAYSKSRKLVAYGTSVSLSYSPELIIVSGFKWIEVIEFILILVVKNIPRGIIVQQQL